MIVIYRAINKKNGKSYIGQTNNLRERKKAHKYNAKYRKTAFYKALDKYGENNFKWEVLEECLTRAEADIAEKRHINKFGGYQSLELYNEREGGTQPPRKRWTEEERRRQSQRVREQELWKIGSLPENVEKAVKTRRETGVYKALSERQKGDNNVSKRKEVRNKISNSVKKLWEDPEYRKRRKPNKLQTCPYCGFQSRSRVIKRWHFENCKNKY